MMAVWIECEECESEYEAHPAEMPPHRCAECVAASEDRFYAESEDVQSEGEKP